LTALEQNAVAHEWLGPVFMDAYLRHKRAEIRMTETMTEEERCALYARAY